jgi:hypothetical protein
LVHFWPKTRSLLLILFNFSSLNFSSAPQAQGATCTGGPFQSSGLYHGSGNRKKGKLDRVSSTKNENLSTGTKSSMLKSWNRIHFISSLQLFNFSTQKSSTCRCASPSEVMMRNRQAPRGKSDTGIAPFGCATVLRRLPE